MAIRVAALAEWLEGQVLGNETLLIDRAQSLSKAGPGSIAFFVGVKSAGLKPINGAVILLSRKLRADAASLTNTTSAFILVEDPKDAFLRVAAHFAPRRTRPEIGISSDAYVSATARVGKETNIHPGAHVGAGVILGDRCDIHPGAVIGRGCRLGDDVVVYSNAVLYDDMIVGNRVILHAGCVIGADGFSYRLVDGRHERIPHFGTVRIEDDVEIGANTTIDRAMVDETVIGQGTKLDNLVMIGHNCELGRHNLFVSQVGLAGSVTTGDYVVCAGQVGIADHVHLGSRSVLGPKAGVHKDVPEGERYVGVPAVPEADCYRSVMLTQKLPEMKQQLRKLERQVADLAALAEQLRKRIGSADRAPRALRAKGQLHNERAKPRDTRMHTPDPMMRMESGRRIGLLAGAGRFPIAFAQAARRQGLSVVGVGVPGMASESLRDLCDYYTTASVARLGRAIRFFKKAGVHHAVMAGKVDKTFLFQSFRWIRNLPDWRTLHMFFRYARENRKDDTLLLAVVREFERDDIHFDSALNFCPELLVKHGFLTRRKPTPAQWRDIRFGWEIAKELGRLDIGQTAIVNDMAVIALEAIEGTDAAIRRAGTLCRRGGFTVVKVAKPQQNMRFDVPTIGVETIQTMREAGGRVLAVESEMTIMLDQPEVIELADRLGIAIVSLKAEEVKLQLAS